MKAILGAGKKPLRRGWRAISTTPTTPLAELVAISVPPQTERKHIILDNDSPEAITALADHLKIPELNPTEKNYHESFS